jgi:hypothetical protein
MLCKKARERQSTLMLLHLDTQYIGNIEVYDKDHPLILAADLVANYLAYQLKHLPTTAPSSIAGWELEQLVWGVG